MLALSAWLLLVLSGAVPAPVGRLVDVGGHKLHLNCSAGRPTVVIENGLGDFSAEREYFLA